MEKGRFDDLTIAGNTCGRAAWSLIAEVSCLYTDLKAIYTYLLDPFPFRWCDMIEKGRVGILGPVFRSSRSNDERERQSSRTLLTFQIY